MRKDMITDDKTQSRPWYLEPYAELAKKTKFQDEESRCFCKEFIPVYLQYVGTRELMKYLRNYINTHEITKKDDFRTTLVIMWCWHIQYYRECRGVVFKPEDVFKIKVPKEILSIK